jgi:hypothetical protein
MPKCPNRRPASSYLCKCNLLLFPSWTRRWPSPKSDLPPSSRSCRCPHRTSRFTNHRLRLEHNRLGIGLAWALIAFQQELSRDLPHPPQRLSNSERQILTAADIVDPDDRNISGACVRPASAIARTAPTATMSLEQNTEVKSRVLAIRSQITG